MTRRLMLNDKTFYSSPVLSGSGLFIQGFRPALLVTLAYLNL